MSLVMSMSARNLSVVRAKNSKFLVVVSRTSSLSRWCHELQVSRGGVTNFKSLVVVSRTSNLSLWCHELQVFGGVNASTTSSFTELATNFASLVASVSAKNVQVVDAVLVGKEIKLLVVSISVKIVESLVGSEQRTSSR